MCGIAGIIGNKEISSTSIDKMVDIISHRGPDDRGILNDDKFSFGMRRLSIIDLEGGHQPMSNEDGSITVVFNGEIYNYKELRPSLLALGHTFKTESDTEGLVHLYEEYGKDMVKYLRGMFAFAIYDSNKNQIFIARDHFGIKPLYFSTDKDSTIDNNPNGGNLLSFGSEIKSILLDPRIKKEINHEGVYQYLSFQYNPLSETLFKRIFKLTPGHHLTIDLSKENESPFVIEKYWNYEFDGAKNTKKSNISEALIEKQLADKTREIVTDSVAHHMISDVPVGTFLSGGIDSGIIATLVQEERNKANMGPVSTFTIGFKEVSEQAAAKEVADRIGSEHNEILITFEEYLKELPKIVWYFDEPVADPSAVSLFFLAREARKKVKVVLSGEGADEFFGGYNIYREPLDIKIIESLPEWIKYFFLRPFLLLPFNFLGKNFIRRGVTKLEDRYIGNANIFNKKDRDLIWKKEKYLPKFLPKDILSKLYVEMRGENDSRKMQYVDINTWLQGDILAKADKMTMANSLELRVPFLDKNVAEFSETIPDKFKYKDKKTKYILRKAFEDILPRTTAERRKLGFPTPFGAWLKNSPDEVMNIILNNEYIKEYMNMDFIKDLVEKHVNGKMIGKVDISRKIYALLMLALWYNEFIKE
ncbi:MAG: asparagine synthase (glutamine-hydrolyzing) [bacterium]